jgi:cytochrome c1
VLIALAAAAAGACGDARGAPALKVEGGDAARGERAIAAYGCGTCHMIPGIREATGMVGPPLTAFARRTIIAGRMPNTADALVRWIRTPQEVDPGTAMPDLNVTERDAKDIAAYLYTLR